MKQYCRYCINLIVNNVPYCKSREKVLSEGYCKRPNNCTDFVFANVESEYQDAFGETNGYKPRQPRQKQIEGQLSFFSEGRYLNDD